MLRKLTVQTPAPQRALSTAARASAASPKLAGVGSAVLERQISEASDRLASLIGVLSADNGTITVGYEEVVEQFRLSGDHSILLSRFPVVSVTTITLDGADIPAGEYSSVGRFGRIEFHNSTLSPICKTGHFSIRYYAGWFLPSFSGYPTLPASPPTPPSLMPDAIELAVFEIMNALVDDGGRDMGLREEQSDEVDRFSYFAGGASSQAWRNVKKRIAPYVRTII